MIIASACLGAVALLRQPLMASATTGWRAGLSAFWIPVAAWKWEMAARVCLMEAMDLLAAATRPRHRATVWGVAGSAPMATGVGPFLEPPPGGCVGTAGVVSLGVPETGGDGLGRLVVGTGQIQGIMDLQGGSQVGGHGRPMKTRDKVILTRALLDPDRQGFAGSKGACAKEN